MAEHDGEWFVVTAGHCIKAVIDHEAKGCRFENWVLDDSVSRDVRFTFSPPPFVWDWSWTLYCDDEATGTDYGIIKLSKMHREQLAANGTTALTRDAWDTDHGFCDFFLLGIPDEGISLAENRRVVQKEARAMYLQWVDENLAPQEMRGKACPRNFFRIASGLDDFAPKIESIKGMSGGPVFGLKSIDGELRYWVLGIQSAWERTSKTIATCPVHNLHVLLGNWMAQQRR